MREMRRLHFRYSGQNIDTWLRQKALNCHRESHKFSDMRRTHTQLIEKLHVLKKLKKSKKTKLSTVDEDTCHASFFICYRECFDRWTYFYLLFRHCTSQSLHCEHYAVNDQVRRVL